MRKSNRFVMKSVMSHLARYGASVVLLSFLAPGLSYGGVSLRKGGKDDGKSNLKASAGHYEGTLTTSDNGHFRQILVKAELSDRKDQMNDAVIQDQKGATVLTLGFSKMSKNGLSLSVPPYLEAPLALKKADDCFSSSTERDVTLCFYRDGIDVEVYDKDNRGQISLTLNKFKIEKPLQVETPQVYNLKTAITRASRMNFDNRIEFEHVMQAKYTAKSAHGNLFPRLNFNTVLANTPFQTSLTGILGSASDLLPFLFPSRWIQAKRLNDLTEAERDTLILLRMDTATQIEALFYNYQHDQVIQSVYKQTLDRARKVEAELKVREDLGEYQAGTTDNMSFIVNQLFQDYSLMDAMLAEERTAIAQVMGFFSPDAVSGVVLDPDDRPITAAKTLDKKALIDLAETRSVELRQVDFLIDAAKKNKKQSYFNWLDPAGDPNLSLGFGLKSGIKVFTSQIHEMELRRNQMKEALAVKMSNAVTDFNTSLTSYRTSYEGTQIASRRLAQQLTILDLKGKLDFFGLVQVFQDYLSDEIRYETAILSYRTARARVDRLLLQGYYTGLAKPVVYP